MSIPTEEQFKRLRESEEKYRKMIESAHDAIFTIDPGTANILEVNPAGEKMTGYTAKELIGKKVWKLHPDDEREPSEALFKKVKKTGSGTCPDLHFLTKSGATLAIDVTASIIEYGDQRVIQRICRDVTERRRLEEANAAQRDYYEFILNMMPVGLGVRKNINKTPAVEFENKRLKQMFHGDTADPAHSAWHDGNIAASGEPKVILDDTGVYTEERRYSDGRVYQFTLSYYKNLEDSWSELQLVRDITHRRRLEDELERAKQELEQKVEERTRELRVKQAQLVQSEKMAALGHLVAGVAHEINTPLGALKSNGDLLVRTLPKIRAIIEDPATPAVIRENPELKKMLHGLEDLTGVSATAMKRIVTIVNSLRTFARLDEADLDTVDIHAGLDSTLTLVHHELKNRIEVHKKYGRLPLVSCFPNQINQVFMNILVNAAQAIEGKGDINITTYQKDENVVIEIRDTGKGIPQELMGRIFDPGFTTKGSGVGTGLGLSIVYQIIEEHRGKIEVESEVEKGTTMRIILPIERQGGDNDREA